MAMERDMMTRNDFELLATALRSSRNDLESAMTPEYAHDIAINAVAAACAGTNSRFDKARFFEAAGHSPAGRKAA
jgi:hypothetical protein